MNLVIDIGNTLMKLAIFDKGKMIGMTNTESDNIGELARFIENYQNIDQCLISSVTRKEDELKVILQNKEIPTLQLSESTKIPFISKYKTPSTLGRDRIAAIAGTYTLYKGKDVLVIDAGTAITFDFKNSKDEYLGGNISPGLEMRFKALNHYTARLPLLEPDNNFTLLGEGTNEAIINGVQNGLIFEIQGYITKLKEIYPDVIIIVTGGNSQFFEYVLKKTIFVVSNLTLIGLNTILDYNVQDK